MIKRLTAWRARQGVAPEEALRYWRVDHAPLVTKVPGVTRYVQNHPTAGPDVDAASTRPYDGLGEVWFESVESANSAVRTAEWRSVIEDAATFMDLDHITAMWVEEHVI